MAGNYWYPDEGVVRFTARYVCQRLGINFFEKKRKVKRVLDAGCGNGRHVVYFAELGFEAYGFDVSSTAIKVAKKWLAKRKLKAHLRQADIADLSFYPDNYFDLIISHGVLDHMLFFKAKKAMKEIKRVCAPGGYVYITLRSTEDSECGRGEEVAKNTFVLKEGYEKGLIQHYFNPKEINELFKGFRVFDLELYEERFPDLFTIDKSFLQSSRGIKKDIDLTKPLKMNLKYSRWFIAAEKFN